MNWVLGFGFRFSLTRWIPGFGSLVPSKVPGLGSHFLDIPFYRGVFKCLWRSFSAKIVNQWIRSLFLQNNFIIGIWQDSESLWKLLVHFERHKWFPSLMWIYKIYIDLTCKVISTCEIIFQSYIQACNFIMKRLVAQVFSCEYCEIFKNTFFTEHLRWLRQYIFLVSTLLR